MFKDALPLTITKQDPDGSGVRYDGFVFVVVKPRSWIWESKYTRWRTREASRITYKRARRELTCLQAHKVPLPLAYKRVVMYQKYESTRV